MKETLYRLLGERNPRAKARYEALRQAGAPRWKAAPALLLPGGGGARPLPVGAGESAQSLGEPPAVLVQRLARFQAVSFDVFDTLLLRQVERPQEAFALVGAKLGYPDFQRLRVEAECRARDKKRRRAGSGEVTLSEIWQELEAATAIPAGEGMAAELAVERALCRGNPYFLPVVEALRQLGKPLGLLSDMYLPGAFVQQLVEEAGFGPFACCLVSGEEGVSKGEGGLYQRWKGRFPPDAPLAHVGDNPHADGEMARVCTSTAMCTAGCSPWATAGLSGPGRSTAARTGCCSSPGMGRPCWLCTGGSTPRTAARCTPTGPGWRRPKSARGCSRRTTSGGFCGTGQGRAFPWASCCGGWSSRLCCRGCAAPWASSPKRP